MGWQKYKRLTSCGKTDALLYCWCSENWNNFIKGNLAPLLKIPNAYALWSSNLTLGIYPADIEIEIERMRMLSMHRYRNIFKLYWYVKGKMWKNICAKKGHKYIYVYLLVFAYKNSRRTYKKLTMVVTFGRSKLELDSETGIRTRLFIKYILIVSFLNHLHCLILKYKFKV